MADLGVKPAELPVGTVLADRYRIDAVLGEGGMGKVYAAEHVLMRKRLAIKILHRELSSVPDIVERFEREAMAAANVDHPNVAGATDFGKLADGSVFLALELVEGRCLRDVMDTGPMPAERALHIARQVAAALGSAHAQGIVHRDLKPENVMLVEKGGDADFVKVLDFGVARVPIGDSPSGAAITRAGMVFGTPEYIPPEQALGQPSDGRADLYSLGVMIFEMLAGVRPFVAETKVSLVGQHIGKPAVRISERAPGITVPEEVEKLVARLLEKEAAKRVQTAGEVAAAIDRIIGKARGVPFLTPAVRSVATGKRSARRAPEASAGSPTLRERVSELVRGLPARGLDAAEALRRVAPRPLRRVLDRAGAPVVAGAGALLFLLLLGGLGLAIRAAAKTPGAGAADERASSLPSAASARELAARPPAAVTPAVAPRDPDPTAVDKARAGGLEGLRELSRSYPASPVGALEQARWHATQKQYPAAAAAVERALGVDPEARSDPRAASALFQAAQATASTDLAFRLLEGPMKERGAAILHDLAVYAPKKSVAQKRAESRLDAPSFLRVAEAPLRLAVAMRRAKHCAEVKRLLPEVKEIGDQHSLVYLEFFQKKLASYPCLKGDRLLSETTAAVKARTGR